MIDPASRLLLCPVSGRCTDRLVSEHELREDARGQGYGGICGEGQEEGLEEPGGESCTVQSHTHAHEACASLL